MLYGAGRDGTPTFIAPQWPESEKIPNQVFAQLAQDVSKGMLLLVRQGIFNQDLKPANIFAVDKDCKQFKIGGRLRQ